MDIQEGFLTGRLGRDVEVRVTNSGKRVAVLSIGTTKWQENQEKTHWFKVTAWEPVFGKIEDALVKGQQVILKLDLAQNDYETREGSKVQGVQLTAMRIMLVGGKPNGASTTPTKPAAKPTTTKKKTARFEEEYDEELDVPSDEEVW